MVEQALAALRTQPFWLVSVILLLENLALWGLAVGIGHGIACGFAKRRVSLPPDPISRTDMTLALSTVLFNTVVTVIGLWLWRRGMIRLRSDVGGWALL